MFAGSYLLQHNRCGTMYSVSFLLAQNISQFWAVSSTGHVREILVVMAQRRNQGVLFRLCNIMRPLKIPLMFL